MTKVTFDDVNSSFNLGGWSTVLLVKPRLKFSFCLDIFDAFAKPIKF